MGHSVILTAWNIGYSTTTRPVSCWTASDTPQSDTRSAAVPGKPVRKLNLRSVGEVAGGKFKNMKLNPATSVGSLPAVSIERQWSWPGRSWRSGPPISVADSAYHRLSQTLGSVAGRWDRCTRQAGATVTRNVARVQHIRRQLNQGTLEVWVEYGTCLLETLSWRSLLQLMVANTASEDCRL